MELQPGTIETERRGGIVVLGLRGEHDIASTSRLANALIITPGRARAWSSL